MKEKIEPTVEEARIIIRDDSETFRVVEEKQTGSSRWSINYRCVVKRESDGKFFATKYSIGATEQQEERPWEYTKPIFEEVFPIERKIIVYE